MSTEPQFYYRDNGGEGDKVRVWRSNWSGDNWETLTRDEFNQFKSFCKRFSMLIREDYD